jgi:hypothetical protein
MPEMSPLTVCSTSSSTSIRRIEFDVPKSSLEVSGSGWARVIEPTTIESRSAAKNRLEIPQLPQAIDIVHVATKIR